MNLLIDLIGPEKLTVLLGVGMFSFVVITMVGILLANACCGGDCGVPEGYCCCESHCGGQCDEDLPIWKGGESS